MKKTLVIVTSIAALVLVSTVVFLAKHQPTATLTQSELKPASYDKLMVPPPPPENCSALIRALRTGTRHKPQKSATPLSEDEIAIYRQVADRLGSDHKILEISNRTFPFDFGRYLDDFASDGEEPACDCFKGIDADSANRASRSYHSLPPTLLSRKSMHLVGSKKQIPEDRASNSGLGIANNNVGFLDVSEVAFDKQRTHAWVSFTFSCGLMYGHSGIVVLERNGCQWNQIERNCIQYSF